MKPQYSLDGYLYRLRPVKKTDAAFIVRVRLEDAERNQYIHTISDDVSAQETWIEGYLKREDDFYFIVENRLTKKPEGLISFYKIIDTKAEWGRWVIQKDSLAAGESVYLLYRIAFEQANLSELYCDTIADNQSVVAFHTSIGELTREVKKANIELNGKVYDSVIQYADKEHFYKEMAPKLELLSSKILNRARKKAFGGFEFHHIGIATRSIDREAALYTLLGYQKEGEPFEDPAQGIKGVFMVCDGHPRVELLENLEGSQTLTKQLETNQKMYHRAYYVPDIEKAIETLEKNRAKVISPLKPSVFFKKRICFLILNNMEMIELLEK